MAVCKDCKFYKPKTKAKDNCFGHEVLATMNAEQCPAKSFQPR